MRYISLFSGIGGLEHPTVKPVLFCERDSQCQQVLREVYPTIRIANDITELRPPKAEFVIGGWPCQDLSSAGTLGGLDGTRSGLFFEMLRVGAESGAHTLIGENVPNLLTIAGGADFDRLLDALQKAGFPHIAWRVLNARAFGLPQERRRLFIVASRHQKHAEALHAKLPDFPRTRHRKQCAAFYWTGGKRSICYSVGCSPALKIGATDNKGRAPVAVFDRGKVRKLSATEFLRLQGFNSLPTLDLSDSTLLRMAGNAVPPPMGHFVVSSVFAGAKAAGVRSAFGLVAQSGLVDGGMSWVVDHPATKLASNLADYLDPTPNAGLLSSQAAAGLIVRSVRSGHPMPIELFDSLFALTKDRTAKLRPSRANSFLALDEMVSELATYRQSLPAAADYCPSNDEYDESEEDIVEAEEDE
jgi:site-specific DNA-cytosine methylase